MSLPILLAWAHPVFSFSQQTFKTWAEEGVREWVAGGCTILECGIQLTSYYRCIYEFSLLFSFLRTCWAELLIIKYKYLVLHLRIFFRRFQKEPLFCYWVHTYHGLKNIKYSREISHNIFGTKDGPVNDCSISKALLNCIVGFGLHPCTCFIKSFSVCFGSFIWREKSLGTAF